MHPYKDGLLAALMWLVVFVAPVKAAMLAVTFLVAVDFLTGVWASKKRGEKIESAKLGRTVIKTLGYQLALITSFVTEKYLLDVLPVMKTISGFIAATELLSVSENLAVITGVPLYDAFRKLLNKKDEKPEA
jgi:phage-related holin